MSSKLISSGLFYFYNTSFLIIVIASFTNLIVYANYNKIPLPQEETLVSETFFPQWVIYGHIALIVLAVLGLIIFTEKQHIILN